MSNKVVFSKFGERNLKAYINLVEKYQEQKIKNSTIRDSKITQNLTKSRIIEFVINGFFKYFECAPI